MPGIRLDIGETVTNRTDTVPGSWACSLAREMETKKVIMQIIFESCL